MIITHSGSPHQDEIFGCALILLCCGEFSYKNGSVIKRVPDVKEDEFVKGYWYVDVGRDHDPDTLKFGHHQFSRDHERRSAGWV